MELNKHLTKVFLSILLLFVAIIQINAQVSSVKGRIVDDKGIPVPGANIILAGTMTGTLTDENGLFTIKVNSPKDSLIVSFIGYDKLEVPVGTRTEFNLVLKTSFEMVDEIVVMGYSDKKKSEVTSAISVIGGDALRDIPSSDMTTMLQGKIAGVQVVAGSGQPGTSAEIRIRGQSTFTGTGLPLYVIDGIPDEQSDPMIDPNMIESVTILKDAGATGMYGSQANAGVIVITTKKGLSEKPTFEVSVNEGYKKPDFGNFALMNSTELKAYRASAYLVPKTMYYNEAGYLAEWPDSINTAKRNYDWLHAVFAPSYVQTYNISASGKSSQYNYFVGATLYNEQGSEITTGYQKLSFRSNNTYTFNENVSAVGNIELDAYEQQVSNWEDITYSVQNNPLDNPYDANGNLVIASQSNPPWRSSWDANGLQFIHNSSTGTNGVNLRLDLGLTVKILPWLTFSSTNRFKYFTDWNYAIILPTADERGGPDLNPATAGSNQQSADYTISYSSTDLLKFNKSFGKNNISGLLGIEFGYTYQLLNMGSSGTGLEPGYTSLITVATAGSPTGYSQESASQSFISQLNYNYNERYFLSGSYREDVTSVFPPNSRSAGFPTISGSWLISKEDFFKEISSIDNLKVRASFGFTGNNNIQPDYYQGIDQFTISKTAVPSAGNVYASNYNGTTAPYPQQVANNGLTWERTSQFNVGFDLGLIKRLEISLDYYNKVTSKLLFDANTTLSTGYSQAWINVGEVYNSGVELELNGSVFKTKDLSWNLEFNISKNVNKAEGVGDGSIYNQTVSNNGQSDESALINGQPIWCFYGPKWLGVNPVDGACLWEQVTKNAQGQVVRTPTETYTAATVQNIGNPWPNFTGGFSTEFRYKFVSLNVNFAFSDGSHVYNANREQFDNDGKDGTLNQQKFISGWSRWVKPGQNATHPAFNASNVSSSNDFSSRYIEDASFLKLRSVALNFNLPTNWAHQKISHITLSLSGNNLMTWTKFTGIDPETSLALTSDQLPGQSTGVYPLSRQFLVALKLQF